MPVKPRTDRPVTVIGSGELGRRIGCVFVAAGYNVHLRDISPEALQAGVHYIGAHKEEFSLMPRISKEKERRNDPNGPGNESAITKVNLETYTYAPFGRYKTFTDIAPAVENAWLAIEAVPEVLDLKTGIFAELDATAPKDCILASTCSSFKSSLMVAQMAVERQEKFLNMHFTMPPAIRTVELMTCGKTDREIFPYLTDVLGECGMLPIIVRRESTGYVFVRLLQASTQP